MTEEQVVVSVKVGEEAQVGFLLEKAVIEGLRRAWKEHQETYSTARDKPLFYAAKMKEYRDARDVLQRTMEMACDSLINQIIKHD